MSSAGKTSNGGKGKKKKWSKGKMKEKSNNAVLVEKSTMDKLVKDISSYKLLTVAVLVERMKINGSAARKVLRDLEERALIKRVLSGSSLTIYTRAVEPAAAE